MYNWEPEFPIVVPNLSSLPQQVDNADDHSRNGDEVSKSDIESQEGDQRCLLCCAPESRPGMVVAKLAACSLAGVVFGWSMEKSRGVFFDHNAPIFMLYFVRNSIFVMLPDDFSASSSVTSLNQACVIYLIAVFEPSSIRLQMVFQRWIMLKMFLAAMASGEIHYCLHCHSCKWEIR